MQIGTHYFASPVIALAPMAGITDQPFRTICHEANCKMIYSEMLASKPELRNSRKSKLRTTHIGAPRPVIVQIVGNNPEQMAQAAQYNVKQGAQIIDINMGCPAKKVCKTAAGSALLKSPGLVKEILQTVVQSVDIPVTLKIRTGWDKQNKNAIEIAQLAEKSGIAALAIHARTRACGFKGDVDYKTVKQVKNAVTIPVLANGDISNAKIAHDVLDQTQADGLLIGRAALGNPWIFSQIQHYLQDGTIIAVPDASEKLATIVRHLKNIYLHYGEMMGVKIARKHFAWYIKDFKHQQQHRKAFNKLATADKQIDLINTLFIAQHKESITA
jgi:tRNA-dihydrouridine synthase B